MGILGRAVNKIKNMTERMTPEELEYYSQLYERVHNLDKAEDITEGNTASRFGEQWKKFPTGKYLLSDPQFKSQVDSILSEQELVIKKEWFRGKKVLDAGCGNGRWSYGFGKLGADLTCVDINAGAIEETRKVLGEFQKDFHFLVSPLEELSLPEESFDLVFSWGVLHHCVSFTKSLNNLTRVLKNGGILYLYLYGRNSMSMQDDLKLFKRRIEYNKASEDERYRMLESRAAGDEEKMNSIHDLLAPTINRRFTFKQIREILQKIGYSSIVQTIDHTEVFVRATKGSSAPEGIFLEPKKPPYWFQ